MATIDPAAALNQPAAFGLQDFMKILLTQLTYQDPLKPMDNQQFMSQIAQFTTLEQSQQLNDKIDRLLAIQSATQSIGLIGKTVDVNGQRVHLTGKEYQMLELLSLRKGTTLTKEMFLNHLYDGMNEPDFKIIDVFICKLRKKLAVASNGGHFIETVWGRGYGLRDPSDVKAVA